MSMLEAVRESKGFIESFEIITDDDLGVLGLLVSVDCWNEVWRENANLRSLIDRGEWDSSWW